MESFARAMPGHLVTAGPWRAWSGSEPHLPGERVRLFGWPVPNCTLGSHTASSPGVFCSFFLSSLLLISTPGTLVYSILMSQLFSLKPPTVDDFPQALRPTSGQKPNIFLKIKGKDPSALSGKQKRHSGNNDERERWQICWWWKGGREGHGNSLLLGGAS